MSIFNFIYPRLVTITRPNNTTGIGARPYQGLDVTKETVLFSNVPASIQGRKAAVQKAGLPGDSRGAPVWVVIIPLNYCPNGSIMDRDIITDEFNIRYQVSAAYWNSLGYQCECERLQT